VIDKYGWSGYGMWWTCVELVAEQGSKYSLKPEKNWKNYLIRTFATDEKKLDEFLSNLADAKLIDKNKLKKGILSIPKLREYCDDYQKQLRRGFEETSAIEEKRREEKRIEEKKAFNKLYPTFKSEEKKK